jgi:hypothetical protein
MSIVGTLVFNGQSRLLKCFIKGAESFGKSDGLLHTLTAHDVGVSDGQLSDPYGHDCKCPPGAYGVGRPQACATRLPDGTVRINNSDDRAYGCWFIPLIDVFDVWGPHGRAGIGLHGGGSDLPDSFALPNQGWEYTFGCIRLQNGDLENTLVPFVDWIFNNGGTLSIEVYWP